MAEFQPVLKKALFAASVAWCLIGSSPASAAVPSNVPPDVQAFAETKGMVQLKQGFLPDPEKFGFANREELDRAQLGIGYPVYLVQPDDWQQALGDEPLTIAKPLQEWEFLITINGTPKTRMTVTRKDSGLMVTGAGGSVAEIEGYLHNLEIKNAQHPVLLTSGRQRYLTEGRGAPTPLLPKWLERLIEVTAVGVLFFWLRNRKIKATDIVSRQ